MAVGWAAPVAGDSGLVAAGWAAPVAADSGLGLVAGSHSAENC